MRLILAQLGVVVAIAFVAPCAMGQPTNGTRSPEPTLALPPSAKAPETGLPAEPPPGHPVHSATANAATDTPLTPTPTSDAERGQITAAIGQIAAVIDSHFKRYEPGFVAWLEDIKLADLPMMLFTGLLVIVGFRQEKITREQSKIMNTALAIQENSLELQASGLKLQKDVEQFTEKSSQIAREASVNLDRAYIYITRLTLSHELVKSDDGSNNSRLTAKLTLKNFGNTPAIERIVSLWWTDLVPEPVAAGRDPQSQSFPLRINMFGSGETLGNCSPP
jgi:hypothetical protein